MYTTLKTTLSTLLTAWGLETETSSGPSTHIYYGRTITF